MNNFKSGVAKTLMLMSVVIVAVSCSDGNEKGFTFSGKIGGVKDSTNVVIRSIERGFRDTIASGIIINDKFTLKGKVERPMLCEIEIEKEMESPTGNYMSSLRSEFMIDNSKFTMTVPHLDSIPQSFVFTMDNYYKNKYVNITGGKAKKEYSQFKSFVYPTEHEKIKADYKSREFKFSRNNFNEDSIAKYNAILAVKEQQYNEIVDQFILRYPDYVISANLIYKKTEPDFAFTMSEYDSLLNLLSNNRDTFNIRRIRENIESKHGFTKGADFKDFESLTYENKTINVSEYMSDNKYTLIDMWASWCGPCRASIPHVRSLYNEYPESLEVISLSVDASENDWRKAMDEEGMEWLQLWSPKESTDQLRTHYRLTSIPYMILITPDKKIIYAGHEAADIDRILQKI